MSALAARIPTREQLGSYLTLRKAPVLLVAVLSIVAAEVGGGSTARFKVELTRWARDGMLAHPKVHGLVGVRDVDERILDEALVKFDAGLRLFHMHAEGMGLVIIVTTMTAATLVVAGGPVVAACVGAVAVRVPPDAEPQPARVAARKQARMKILTTSKVRVRLLGRIYHQAARDKRARRLPLRSRALPAASRGSTRRKGSRPRRCAR